MEDLAHLEKLKTVEQRILKENETAQEQRQKIRSDYMKLKEKLNTLPDTTSQSTMIPIGDVGFFAGKLIHTNEIMVLLGDSWFAERSANQASKMVTRRIHMVDSQLNELKKEHENIKAHLQFAGHFQQIQHEHDGIMEIKENITDQPSHKGKSRTAHKAKHEVAQRSVKFKSDGELLSNLGNDLMEQDGDSRDSCINHNELLARLNELEKEEQEEEDREHNKRIDELMKGSYLQQNKSQLFQESTRSHGLERQCGELDRRQSHDSLLSAVPSDQHGRHVQFESDMTDGRDQLDVIRFAHTHSQVQRGRSASESDVTIHQQFNSPADIYNYFRAKQMDSEADERPLKSILKKDSRSNSSENLRLKPILKTSPDHRPETPEYSIDEPKPILKTPPDTQGSERRPGTPEYTLYDEPKPILKTQTLLETQRSFEKRSRTPEYVVFTDDEPKPILKTPRDSLSHRVSEVHFADCSEEIIVDYSTEETRSILKSPSDTSDNHILPEGYIKHEHPRTILKPPEFAHRQTESERKPILKNPSNEIIESDGTVCNETKERDIPFSGQIVERDVWAQHSAERLRNQSTNPSAFRTTRNDCGNKPMSRFKASRSKK